MNNIFRLTNNSSFCYFNSIIQCLFNLELLNDIILKINITDNCNDSIKIYHKTLSIINSTQNKIPLFGLTGFQQIFINNSNKFEFAQQEDAEEFLLYLLNILHDNLKQPLTKSLIEGSTKRSKEAFYKQYKNDYSPILKLFHIQVRTIFECKYCGLIQKKYESMLQLYLDTHLFIKQTISIHDILNTQYKTIEKLDGYTCPKCKNNNTTSRISNISSVPKILIIIFKKFLSKQIQIECPIILELNEYISWKPTNKPIKYKINSGVFHIGNTRGGHYFAVCNKNDGNISKWVVCDDEIIREINPNLFTFGDSYILFYERM